MIALTANEQQNGMFSLNNEHGTEEGYMGFNEVLSARNAFTLNIVAIKLQRCGGCDQEMPFDARTRNSEFGMYGYTHTACGFSGKYRRA